MIVVSVLKTVKSCATSLLEITGYTDSSRWLALYQSPFRFYIFDRSLYVSIRVFVFEVSICPYVWSELALAT